MGKQLFTNNAAALLVGGISDVAVSLTVTASAGAEFPTITGSDYFLVTLCQVSGVDEINHEIVKVTARAGDVFTIVRAQEGTTARAFNSGDKVELRITAGGLNEKAILGANTFTGDQILGNNNLKTIKTATFNGQITVPAVSGNAAQGNLAIDWSAGQNYIQTEPTGAINYATGGFTAPPGVCHLQLIINSDGTSTAQTITWPASVIWIGTTWAGANNKKAIINFWYDGTNYFAMGSNQA